MTVVLKENSELAEVVVFIIKGKKERKIEVKTTDLPLIKYKEAEFKPGE